VAPSTRPRKQPFHGLSGPDHAVKHSACPKKKPREAGFWIAIILLLLAEILMAGAAGLADRSLSGRSGASPRVSGPGNADRPVQALVGVHERDGLAQSVGRAAVGKACGACHENFRQKQ